MILMKGPNGIFIKFVKDIKLRIKANLIHGKKKNQHMKDPPEVETMGQI